MNSSIPRYLSWLALCALPLVALGEEPVSKSRFGGVAIGGKDPVAYRSLQRDEPAVDGEGAFSVVYKGATWRFANADDASRFRADPERYAPAYNGFCANALSLDKGLLKTDGSHWLILDDDRLYLFYAAAGRQRWLHGDVEAFRAAADRNWARILAEQR